MLCFCQMKLRQLYSSKSDKPCRSHSTRFVWIAAVTVVLRKNSIRNVCRRRNILHFRSKGGEAQVFAPGMF